MTVSGPTLDYDVILRYIGQCGRWQWQNFFWLWLTSAAGGLAVVVWAFTAFSMSHRCLVPYCEASIEDASYFGSDGSLPTYVLDPSLSCRYLEAPRVDMTCTEYSELNASTLVEKECPTENLVWDYSVVQSSLRKDYGLFCNKSVNASVLGATYMLGMLFGSFIIGLVSDKYGRMKALMISIVCVSVSGFIGAFLPEPVSFGFFRFITGIGGIGCFMVSFVLSVEFVGPKYTMLIGIAIEIPFALGELLLGLEAYFIRDWVTLQIVAHAPLIILLFLWFVVPESPRWLLATGNPEKAIDIIKKAAKVNKKTLPQNLFEDVQHPTKNFQMQDSSEPTKPTILDLFRPKIITLRSFNMFYQWFSVTMCYYGLSFASTSLSGDSYTNFCLSVFIEIPGYLFCIFVMDCWGRRPILSFCQALSGVACILAGLLFGYESLAVLQIILSLIGKFGASACFAIVYVYTAELFPTVIRNTAIGSCSTVARVGGICALLILELNVVWGPLPMIIMGCVAVVAGCLAIFFPETVGHQLPETMEEAINIGKDSSRGLCTCVCPKSFKEMFSEEEGNDST